MSAIPYPSKTNYLRVPDTATKKKDQLKGFSIEEVAKVSLPTFYRLPVLVESIKEVSMEL